MKECFIPKSTSQSVSLPALVRKVAYRPIALVLVITAVLTPTFSYLLTSREKTTPAQAQARLENFQAAVPLPLPTVNLNDTHELQEALRTTQLKSAEVKQLQSDINRMPNSRLIWVDVFDDCDEDGDVIAIKSLTFSQQIPIFHTPHRVAVYVMPGERQILLTGIRDGYGGITVAVKTNIGIIQLPYLLPGQTVAIPFL